MKHRRLKLHKAYMNPPGIVSGMENTEKPTHQTTALAINHGETHEDTEVDGEDLEFEFETNAKTIAEHIDRAIIALLTREPLIPLIQERFHINTMKQELTE